MAGGSTGGRQRRRGSRRLCLAVAALALLGLGVGVGQGELLFTVDTTPGEIVYAATCAACHQVDGRGLPAAFPPLAAHIPRLLASDDGRAYLPAVVLHGLTGPIEVEGDSYDGVMPPWLQLRDQQLADVLNYVAVAWGNDRLLPAGFIAYSADEIAVARTSPFDSASLQRLRVGLLGE